ncbi:hypothetical protein RvY_10267 [Ramazzottius varieornatus]|uniref:Uncharacterized protein n=1 Tax=Ramazzottius varieornatus TaxID=947166 RepID=A0A1D1VEN9_RAMVA|nr:hypothetical protein RvY_10267 [Ramazzottius varieornatus]
MSDRGRGGRGGRGRGEQRGRGVSNRGRGGQGRNERGGHDRGGRDDGGDRENFPPPQSAQQRPQPVQPRADVAPVAPPSAVSVSGPQGNAWGARPVQPQPAPVPQVSQPRAAGSPSTSIPSVAGPLTVPEDRQRQDPPVAKSENKPTASKSAEADVPATSMQALSLSSGPLQAPMQRPPNGFGTRGVPILIAVNHYDIHFKDGSEIHWYSLKLAASANGKPVPSPLRPALKREIMSKFRQQNPELVLGGGRGMEIAFNKADEVFSAKSLPFAGERTVNFVMKVDGDSREYQVTVTLNKVRDFKAAAMQESLRKNKLDYLGMTVEDRQRALDTIFRQGFLSSQHVIEVGRSLFVPSQKTRLPEGLETMRKVFASIRMSGLAHGLALVLNTSEGAFYKVQLVLDYLRDRGADIPPAKNPNAATFTFSEDGAYFTEEYLKNLKVTYKTAATPTQKSYEATKTVRGLSQRGASDTKFPLQEEGQPPRQITVQQYFLTHYNIVLKYPKLQLIQASTDPQRPVYLPMEICMVKKNQQIGDRASQQVIQAMIKLCAAPAPDRMAATQQERLKIAQPENNVLNEFGVVIGNNMAVVQARVLPTPQITQGNKSFSVSTQHGQSWQSDRDRLEEPKHLQHWILIWLGARKENRFVGDLKRTGGTLGMNIADPWHELELNPRNVMKNLKDHITDIKDKDLQLIFFVVMDEYLYKAIKQMGDVDLGVRSQVIKGKNANDRCMANILRKVNVKLGGSNHKPQLPAFITAKKVMVIGADVTHPGGGALRSRPSLAAVVGSTDTKLLKYKAEIRAQVNVGGKLLEIIENLEDMVTRLFVAHKEAPDMIFYYRDGVSEGQYSQILTYEFAAIVRAYSRLYKKEPKITCIVVTKRHITRMKCKNDREGVGKAANVPPGTVADKDFCGVEIFDWYMVSHYGIQGTSRPAHYIVLLDQNHLTADQLQELSYSLAYGYARCTRSVSLPIPVYYAHHAAFRARDHLGDGMYPDLGSDNALKRREALQDINRKVTLSDDFKNGGMYFL